MEDPNFASAAMFDDLEPHLELTNRRITMKPVDPKRLVKNRVNDVANILRSLIETVREHPSAITAEDATKIHHFLAGQVDAAGETIARLIGNDPGVAAYFDFEMPIAPPQAPRERHPFSGAATPRLASRKPSAADSGDAKPVGRLVGSREKVFGEPEQPLPTKPADAGDDNEVDFLETE